MDLKQIPDAGRMRRLSCVSVICVLAAPALCWLAASPAEADGRYSAEDKGAIVQTFLSHAARLDANDIHAYLTGVMGLVSEEPVTQQLDFSLEGENTGIEPEDFEDVSTGILIDQPDDSDGNRGRRNRKPQGLARGHHADAGRDGSRSFAEPGTFRRPVLRPAGLLFGFRDSVRRRSSFDLESARLKLVDEAGPGMALPDPVRFNVWLTTQGETGFEQQVDPTSDRGSGAWALSTGAHYKLTPGAMVGALFRARSAVGSSAGLSTTADLRSYGVGLYGGLALTDNVTFSVLGLYQRGDNAVTIDEASGTYRSDQYSVSANLKGNWRHGNWWISPSASVTWNRTGSDSYLDSAGDAVAAGVTENAQATFGPQIGYVYFGDEHVKAVRPHVALTGVYAFLDSGPQSLSGGAIPGARGFYGEAVAGIDIWFDNSVTMKFDAGYHGIGAADVDAWTVRGKVNIPFR